MLKILTALLLFTTFNTFACEEGTLEAEVTGMVYALDYSYPEAGNIEHFTYQLSYERLIPNSECPLEMDLANTAVFWIQGAPYNIQNNDDVTGRLVYFKKFNSFQLLP